MKISPMAAPSTSLPSVQLTPQETGDTQADRVRPNVRSIKMNTQQSTTQLSPEAPLGGSEDLSIIQAPVEPAKVEVTQPLSPQLAEIAKQKRAIQVKEMELKKREEALKAAPTQEGNADLVNRLKSQPLSVLQELGITYDKLTEDVMAEINGQNPEVAALKAEIEALKKGVDEKFTTRESQQTEAALTEMLYQAEGLAKDNEAYEMIRERNAFDQVLRKIYQDYQKTGRVLDVSDAMDFVENKLLAEAEKIARIKKVQGRIAPPASPVAPKQQLGQMRTLTSRDNATAAMSRKARAIAAMTGTLKR